MSGLSNRGILPDTISTMNRMTREAGSADTLKAPLLAAATGPFAPILVPLANPIVGSGLGGAMLTNAINPTNADAGIFTNLGRIGRKALNSGVIKDGASWVMSDGRKLYEIPTNKIAKGITEGKPFRTMQNEIGKLPSLNKLNLNELNQVREAVDYIKNHNQRKIGKIPAKLMGINRDTLGIYYNKADRSFIRKGATGKSEANSSIHEVNHGVQNSVDNDRYIGNPEYKSRVPYADRRYEIESRMAGRRAGYPHQLTDPNSKYGIHPEVLFSTKNKRFHINPEHGIMNAIYGKNKYGRQSYEEMMKHINNLNDLYQSEPDFRRVVDIVHENVEQ